MSETAEEARSEAVLPTQVKTRGARPPRLAAVPKDVGVTAAAPVQVITVQPTTIDLVIYQGDDFYLDVYVTDSNSNPINITAMVPMSQIRSAPDAPTILASFNIAIDGTTTNLMHLHLASTDANGLPAECAWDLQLSQPSVTTIIAGTVTVTPQVTQ